MKFLRTVFLAFVVILAGSKSVIHMKAATFVVRYPYAVGPGSLRQALIDASLNPGVDEITFSNVTGRIALSWSSIGDTIIRGPSARRLTIDACHLVVGPSESTSISGLRMTCTNIPLASYGGIISNAGNLFLTDCEFVNAYGVTFGAAVYSGGNLTISNSTFAGNRTEASGLTWPVLTCSAGSGAGLYVSSGIVRIINSTFSGNASATYAYCYGRGGAVYVNSGSVQFVNCTLTGNYASEGGGIYNGGGVVTLQNTIVTDTTVGVDRTAGNNLFTNATAAGLGPLHDNGGPTLTHSLASNSLAINRGTCAGASSIDQRGVLRPQGSQCDIGAFEFERPPNSFELYGAVNGPGIVSVVPKAVFHPSNAVVSAFVITDEDYALDFWSGDAVGRDNPLAMRMDSDKAIVANIHYAPATIVRPPGATNYVVNTNAWGPGSLRQAIRDANASGGGTIRFSNVTGTITLLSGLPPLAQPIRIFGPGPSNLSVTIPSGVDQIVVNAGVAASISRVTIKSTRPESCCGGAISNAGDLVLRHVHLLNCSSSNGGAVLNVGSLRAERCVFSQNSAISGGAIYNQGDLYVTVSTFAGNRSYTHSQDNLSGGGALYHATGAAFVDQCIFFGNGSIGAPGIYESPFFIQTPSSGKGGAIYLASGSASLLNTLISSNVTRGGHGAGNGLGSSNAGDALGSGIYLANGAFALTNSALINNRGVAGDSPSASRFPGVGGTASGGGIHVERGNITAVGCTLSGNEVQGGITGGGGSLTFPPLVRGGGVDSRGGGLKLGQGTTTFLNCTIFGNRALGGNYGGAYGTNFGRGLGGGIYGVMTILNTILSGNAGTTITGSVVAGDLLGTASSLGHNLFGPTIGFTNFLPSDLRGVDPRLGPLTDNGGATPTHALLAGSPAIDAGIDGGLIYDGRGQPRTIDSPAVPNSNGGNGTDIGALEVNHILTGTEVRDSANNIQVRFTTVSDKSYGIQYRPEVAFESWTVLPGSVAGTGGIATYTDTNAALLPRRFYRIFER